MKDSVEIQALVEATERRAANKTAEELLEAVKLVPKVKDRGPTISQGYMVDDIFNPETRLELALRQLELLECHYRLNFTDPKDPDPSSTLDSTQKIIAVLKQVDDEYEQFMRLKRTVTRLHQGESFEINNTFEALKDQIVLQATLEERGHQIKSISVNIDQLAKDANGRPRWAIVVNGKLWGFSDGPFFR